MCGGIAAWRERAYDFFYIVVNVLRTRHNVARLTRAPNSVVSVSSKISYAV